MSFIIEYLQYFILVIICIFILISIFTIKYLINEFGNKNNEMNGNSKIREIKYNIEEFNTAIEKDVVEMYKKIYLYLKFNNGSIIYYPLRECITVKDGENKLKEEGYEF